MAGAAVLCLFALLAGIVLPASEAMSGAITIAGNGPELREIERLTRACEEAHLGVVTEIRWDCSLHLELETAVRFHHNRNVLCIARLPVLTRRMGWSERAGSS